MKDTVTDEAQIKIHQKLTGKELRGMPQFATLKQGITAPFLRLARRLKLHITFEMDNRRT